MLILGPKMSLKCVSTSFILNHIQYAVCTYCEDFLSQGKLQKHSPVYFYTAAPTQHITSCSTR